MQYSQRLNQSLSDLNQAFEAFSYTIELQAECWRR